MIKSARQYPMGPVTIEGNFAGRIKSELLHREALMLSTPILFTPLVIRTSMSLLKK